MFFFKNKCSIYKTKYTPICVFCQGLYSSFFIIFEKLRYALDERVIKLKDHSLVEEGQPNLIKIWYNDLYEYKRCRRRRS